jgi:hypothetical protein
MHHHLICQVLLDQGGVHPVAQAGLGELGEGARKGGGTGNVALALPAADAPQVGLEVEHLDQQIGVGQVVECLGQEGTGDGASLFAITSKSEGLWDA